MAVTLRVKRRTTGGSGAPASLKSGEIAYNNVDGLLYIGYGDDGSGNATSVKPFAKDDFSESYRLPPGGGAGQILVKDTTSDYDVSWQNAPEGAIYTGGTGINVSGGTINIDDAVVVTHSDLTTSLSSYATTTALSTGLSGKADTNHGHDASDITSGTIDAARLPTGVLQAPIVSSGTIANLTTGQQAEIVEGSTVTTTDGRMWMYSGAGDKTLEASYIELADKTPDWSAISGKPSFATVATSGSYTDLSNRPTFATVATSGSYNDLSNLPTLGSIASQNSNNVTITGGTINNVTLDGGTF